MTSRTLASILVTATAFFLTGCGKGEGSQTRAPDLDFTGPVYPALPDTAPLRDQLDEAAAFVERELLEEQEKFFLKRREEIQAYYRGPDGAPLIPETSLQEMLRLMETTTNPRLKISCRNFHLKAGQGQGGVREAPENTRVRMLGLEVPAIGEYAGMGEGTRLRVSTVYEYPNGPIPRDLFYQKQPDGRWKRVRIQESGQAQRNMEPVAAPPQNTGAYPPR